MAVQRLLGGDMDRIARSHERVCAYKVLLFDPFQDSVADIVLDTYTQAPVDVTAWVESVSVTQSHDTESNQASFTFVGADFNWRLVLYSWVKVYEGDARVDPTQWPLVFTGVFRGGQPSRINQRGSMPTYSHTAYDRSVYFRDRRHTSGKAWQPNESNVDVGQIAREFAINADWGMGLDPREVLFGKLGFRINKKLQIVDVPAMEALRNIMQVVQKEPAFNGEGKLIARPVDLDRPAVRVYSQMTHVKKVEQPGQTAFLPNSVTVRGLDYRLSRVDHERQKVLSIGPTTIGMFTPKITSTLSYSDDNEFRVELEFGPHKGQTKKAARANIRAHKFEGDLLSTLFALDQLYYIRAERVDDFRCHVTMVFQGAYVAVAIVTVLLALYIGLKLAGAIIGSANFLTAFIGWLIEIVAVLLLYTILQAITALGKFSCEVWGLPFEYVYKELEAKARLADSLAQEEEGQEVENHILGTLEQCEELARKLLRRAVAETQQRNVDVLSDPILEPNDVIRVEEEGETAGYYVLEVRRDLKRGDEPVYSLSAFRAR